MVESGDKSSEANTKSKKNNNFYGRLAVVDPCLEEKEMSTLCNTLNGSSASICQDYRLNYIKCKEFWEQIKAERRQAGIRPDLPPPDEREKIMKAKFGR